MYIYLYNTSAEDLSYICMMNFIKDMKYGLMCEIMAKYSVQINIDI